MSDIATQLATLRALRASVTDQAQVAALDAVIATLEAQLSQHEAPSEPSASATSSAGEAGSVSTGGSDYAEGDIDKREGTFVAGDQYNLTLFFASAGINDPSAEQRELVAAYLARLAQRCDRLRLSGAVRRERRDAGAPLTLSQVYVTLAAEAWEPLPRPAATSPSPAGYAHLMAPWPSHSLPGAHLSPWRPSASARCEPGRSRRARAKRRTAAGIKALSSVDEGGSSRYYSGRCPCIVRGPLPT